MRAAFIGSLCDSNEIGNAGAGSARLIRRVASDIRADLAVRLGPRANLTVSGSEVACGLR